MVMVDLHCHLLPGIDDGSKSMEISLRLAKEATENGVTHALLTPHHMNGHYVNHKQDVLARTKEFQEELEKNNIPLTVFPGQEVRINGQLIEALDNDDILFADESGKYMMLEFPDNDVPHYTNQMILAFNNGGLRQWLFTLNEIPRSWLNRTCFIKCWKKGACHKSPLVPMLVHLVKKSKNSVRT